MLLFSYSEKKRCSTKILWVLKLSVITELVIWNFMAI